MVDLTIISDKACAMFSDVLMVLLEDHVGLLLSVSLIYIIL